MAVVDPMGAARLELCAALEESWVQATPRDGVWEARIARGRPVVRVLVKDRWWELRLKSARSGGQRATYERIASGAAVGELSFYRVPADDKRLGNATDEDSGGHPEIMCRMVAWLPCEQVEDAKTPQDGLLVRASRVDSSQQLEELDISDLREAIRANLVSFPSQVPTFIRHDRPDLQWRLAQLYFVLGWDCNAIGARYDVVPARVRQILNMWKRRAVETGYIQHIPPIEMAGEWAMTRPSLHPGMTAGPDPGAQFVHTPLSSAIGGAQADLVSRT
jgi:hypothetical protein